MMNSRHEDLRRGGMPMPRYRRVCSVLVALLAAMGARPDLAQGAIRVSFGWDAAPGALAAGKRRGVICGPPQAVIILI